jgi:uncharacterized membrane protein YccC
MLALDRVIEIAVGCVIGIAVSILVLPYRAEQQLVDRVAAGLRLLAELVTALIGGSGGADQAAVDRLNEQMRTVLATCEATALDVRREQRMHLAGRRDPEPLFRTLRRLRSDVAIIDRAVARLAATAGAPALDLAPVAAAIVDFFAQAATALPRRAPPPSLAPLDAAISQRLGAESADAHLPVSFALTALRRDCGDLCERMAERTASA